MKAAVMDPATAGSEQMSERLRELEDMQRAMLNILEDFYEERKRSDEMKGALLNIMEDMEIERARTERAKASLELANRELEAFSYSASHDLQAPLRAINGFSQAVIEDYAPQLDEQGRKYLEMIQLNAHRMGQLIDDLLAFSRLGRQPMREEAIDLGSMARSVFDELISLKNDRDIKLIVNHVPTAKGDPNMMRQVLVNLIGNSVKYTGRREAALIEMGHSPSLRGGAYWVKDNGAGFDMKYVDKLFNVFQRLHSTAEFEGTGVGLAIVQRVIVRHGGEVWAEGAVDQGATVFFTLPGRRNDG